MSVTLTISDKTYQSLANLARQQEKETVEQFLEDLTAQLEREAASEWEKELERRREQVAKIKAFQKRMKDKYGVMPNSVDLIREDRNR
jgi:CCR4-NOT transcriptional regulation complex NOT5 subunit